MKKSHEITKSLDEVHSSVDTIARTGFWKKLFAFLGPAYLVSVGYMDPGNWATDIAGGSKFGYSLIWILVMSNLMALLLQSLSARLGLVQGLDLAQASRKSFPKPVNYCLWFLAEIAIAATDLAEVIGMAIGLQLLFDIPLLIGVSITVLDTLLLLVLQRYGMRKMEAFILALIGIIGISFIIQIFISSPSPAGIASGLIPGKLSYDALYIAIGIIGATVMPHNLYLHSSLVQTRKIERNESGIKEAIKFNLIDTGIALNMALFVNASILILAAATFFTQGHHEIAEIQDAHKLLAPLLGSELSPILFAIALIAAGQSSTLTGTLSGQIVMEGYLNLRIQPWLRRLITRLIAIIPAFITIYLFGEEKTGELLILSQVILSLQLGFAIIPLIHFVSDKKSMGTFVIKPLIIVLSWVCALIIISLNVKLVYETLVEWISEAENKWTLYVTVFPLAAGAGALLLYVSFYHFLRRKKVTKAELYTPHGDAVKLKLHASEEYKRIAITIGFTEKDNIAVNHAVSLGGRKAEYLLIHIVETAGARIMKSEIQDMETISDKNNLENYANDLRKSGYRVNTAIGFGDAKKEIPEIVNRNKADLLVIGAHGHGGLRDILYGTIIDSVRHNINIPVLIIK